MFGNQSDVNRALPDASRNLRHVIWFRHLVRAENMSSSRDRRGLLHRLPTWHCRLIQLPGMSTAAVMWSSSPSALGRPSSPLNPHTNYAGPSSSPVTSPTPPQHHQFPSQFTLGAPPMRHRPASNLQTRYNRPSSRRASSFPLQTPPHAPSGGDPFGEGKGATPVESAMWKERFTRRVKDRERRKRARDEDINRRRSMERSDEILDEEEADRRAQEDDEEVRLALAADTKATSLTCRSSGG